MMPGSVKAVMRKEARISDIKAMWPKTTTQPSSKCLIKFGKLFVGYEKAAKMSTSQHAEDERSLKREIASRRGGTKTGKTKIQILRLQRQQSESITS